MDVNFRNETVQLSKVYLNFTDAFKISWSEKILITNPCTLRGCLPSCAAVSGVVILMRAPGMIVTETQNKQHHKHSDIIIKEKIYILMIYCKEQVTYGSL